MDSGVSILSKANSILPAWTSFQPVQNPYHFVRVPQPVRDYSRLEWVLSRIEVSIQQFRNFFGRAWLPDLVQRSKDVLIQAPVRFWRLTHLRLSRLRVDVWRAHFAFGLATKEQQVRKKRLL